MINVFHFLGSQKDFFIFVISMFSLEESPPRAFVFNRSQSSCIFRLVGYPLGLPFFHFITAGSTFSFRRRDPIHSVQS